MKYFRSFTPTLVLVAAFAATSCTGQRGTTGPAGAAGPQGQPGATGPQGDTGAVGANGVTTTVVKTITSSADPAPTPAVTPAASGGSVNGAGTAQAAAPAPFTAPTPATASTSAKLGTAPSTPTPATSAPETATADDGTNTDVNLEGTTARVRRHRGTPARRVTPAKPVVQAPVPAKPTETPAPAPAVEAAAPPEDPNCPDVQVDEQYFGSVRDQGGMGLCYAYSTADLVTYCLNEGKVKKEAYMNGEGDVVDLSGNKVDYTKDLVYRREVKSIDGVHVPDLTLMQRVSALDVGLNYDFVNFDMKTAAKAAGAVEDGGGDQRAALNALVAAGGACMETHITSDAFAYDQLMEELNLKAVNTGKADVQSTMSLINKIVGYKEVYDQTKVLACTEEAEKGTFPDFKTDDPEIRVCDAIPGTEKGQKDEPRFAHLAGLSKLIKDSPLYKKLGPNHKFPSDIFSNEQFLGVLMSTNSPADVLKTIDERFCTTRRPLPDQCSQGQELIAGNPGVDANTLLSKIDERLNAKEPVGIGIYVHGLKGWMPDPNDPTQHVDDPNALTLKDDAHPNGTLQSEGGHAIIVSGRKSVGGVCEYRIRNSWGQSCDMRYSNGEYTHSAQYPLYNSKYVSCNEADKGYIYVPKPILQKILLSAFWLGK